jgi:glutaredoxin
VRWILFTTKNCPACDRMKRNLFEADISHGVIDMEKDKDLYNKLHFAFVRSAPTLVIVNDGKVVNSYSGSLPVHELRRLREKYGVSK